MRLTTPGRLLIESAIPDKYLSGVTALTKKDLSKIFTRISQEEPENYEDIMAKFTDVSRDVVYRQGREASVGLDDLTMSDKLRVYRDSVRKKLREIQQNPYLKGAAKNKAIVDYLYKEMAVIPDRVVEDASARNSAFYAQVNSGARGNKSQLQQCVFGDGLLVDAENRPVPIPVTHSYAEGVQPMEFWAASSGARKGSIDVQFATADGGYLGKQLSNLGHRMIVTERDCGTKQALSVDAQDLDNIGSVLAKTTNGVPAGTIITKDNIGKLGKGKILVRSVATCGCQDGICSVCAGVRERNSLPPIGDPIGIVAARAISEPITQSGLKCLHPDTLVRMADWSVKPLKDIVVGDFVLGADIKGVCKPAKVTNVFNNGNHPIYKTVFKADDTECAILSTVNHKILAKHADLSSSNNRHDGVIIPIKDIDSLYDVCNTDSNKTTWKKVSSTYVEDSVTLDIEVDNKDHLFVLANGLIVSNSKHTGGVAGMDDKKVHGFEELNQFIQVPNNFKGAATLSEIDGVVTSIKQAAAGGTYVTVNDKQFYVPRDSEVIVKKGDSVSAGDMLSDGTPNPGELIKYKGIGEGRKYFIEKYRDLLDKNGSSVHRRNIEAVARGFVNRIEISDIDGYNGYMINDVIPYDTFAFDYEPRENSKTLPPILSRDKFLEAPVLHYSIGTRITPAVIKELKANNIEKVTVNDKAPVFSPFIVRTKSLLQTDPDWQTALAGENLKKTLLQSARLGGTSSPEGTSYFPAMANPTTVDLYKGGDQNKPLIQENYVKVT